MAPKSIAILGGGLSGLSSAFHLSRRFPTTKLTLIEKQTRLGGWVRSQRVTIKEKASILLEAGPRTLRPNSKSVLELVMYSILFFFEIYWWVELMCEKVDTSTQSSRPSNHSSQDSTSSTSSFPVHSNIITIQTPNFWSSTPPIILHITVNLSFTPLTSTCSA
jgi:uncharacterized protein with NAD-binding domain and iron-sulfur cluster